MYTKSVVLYNASVMSQFLFVIFDFPGFTTMQKSCISVLQSDSCGLFNFCRVREIAP
jgi:hypothetical protein